jgi:cold shock CspA family protein
VIGYVKMYDAERRFGFIKADGSMERVFLHAVDLEVSGFNGKPAQGERVSFDAVRTEKGLRAMNVSRA